MFKKLRNSWPTTLVVGVCVFYGALCFLLSPAAYLRINQCGETCPQERDGNATDEFLSWFVDMSADGWVAVFTGLTAAIFFFQLLTMRRTNEHFRLTERAYAKVSPVAPGVRWDGAGKGGFTLTFRIKNFGSTPANVTDVVSNAIAIPKNMIIDSLPGYARHEFPKESKSFLVKNDEFYQHPHNAIDDAERPEVDAGDKRLIVYGYVDYIDQFGCRHRGGFGRQYLPNATENNMIFPDTGPFNYDRVRETGEGIDWD